MSNDTAMREDPNTSVVEDLTTDTFDEQVRDGLTVVDFWAP
jgi:hypothetical protein